MPTTVAGSSIRLLFVPTLILLALACSDITPPETPLEADPAAYTMSLSSPALTIQAGTSTPTTTVNLVRTNFTGPVMLAVDIGNGTGALPPGVTATFAPNPATGRSSVLTLAVGPEAVPGVYDLSVYGDQTAAGSSGLAPLTLTVTAAPEPSYALALAPPTLSSPQGSSSPTTLHLVRINFTGDVTLSVENLPTGVSAFFYPNATSGNSSRLSLSVADHAPTGTFTNLLVRGVASGLADQTALLTLEITGAPFTFTLSSPAITIVQGAPAPTTTVNVIRNDFTGPVTLVVDYDFHGSLPPGVTASWAPNPVSGNSSELTLLASAEAVPGVYELWVWGYSSALYYDGTPLTLTVIAPAGTTSR